MKDVLGNHLKDRLFHLVHWLSITLLLRRTSQESINLEREILPGLFLGYALYAGGICKGDVLVDLEELETMDASETYSKKKTQMRKRWYFPKKMEKFILPVADGPNQTSRMRSGPENIHLDTASSNSRRQSHWFSWRIRRISSTTSRLVSWCGWSNEWLLGPCQEITYTAITLNPGSNFTRREKNHSLFHWSTLTSPELFIRTWMLCKNAASTIIWNIDGSKVFVWFSERFHSIYSIGRKPPDGYVRSGWRLTRKQLTSRPDHLWPELWDKMGKNAKLKEKQKWSHEKAPSW